jgi:hypothetical protein
MDKRTERIGAVKLALLQGKTWRYLRYLHAREALLMAEDAQSVLVVGAGHGLAELALALEFPQVRFQLTDWGGASHSTSRARAWVDAWGIENVGFSALDILDPKDTEPHDMVYSVEVLEHIKGDETAARNMRRLASKYVFCMVPFAEEAMNQDAARRTRALERFEHHLCGYNVERLIRLFPNPVAIRGAYWEAGKRWREDMKDMTPEQIAQTADMLMERAEADLQERIPTTMSEALGIWWLSRA